MSEIKILDDNYVSDTTRLDGIRITFSKSVKFNIRKKSVELINVALDKLKKKRILDIIKKEFRDIIILHENEYMNYAVNTRRLHHHWASEIDFNKVRGLYIPGNKTIVFTTPIITKNPSAFIETIIHEIGHAVHDNCLSPDAKKFFDNTSMTLLSFLDEFVLIDKVIQDRIKNTDKNIFKQYLFSYLKSILLDKIISNNQQVQDSLNHYKESIKKMIPDDFSDLESLILEDLEQEPVKTFIRIKRSNVEKKDLSLLIDSITNKIAKKAFVSVFYLCEAIDNFNITDEQYELYKNLISSTTDRVVEDNIARLFNNLKSCGIKELEYLVEQKYIDLLREFNNMIRLNKRIGMTLLANELNRFVASLFPSKYSMQNHAETFAECFLYWVLGSDNLKMFDKFRMQYTMSISATGGRQIRADSHLRQYIKTLLETNFIQFLK